ncbi:MAG: FAD-binding oxidoreductase [Salinisphaeraceae bacterium]|nr:FAD-binding oxidoreductase [Salinisphaeraceae bacterium]
MKRWNGWGHVETSKALPAGGLEFLASRIGEGGQPRDASLETALATVPPSRLADLPGLEADEQLRLCHARGQSFADWLALRHGRPGPFPDAVCRPASHEQVTRMLALARREGAFVIPYGGGTSVVGHLQVPADAPPVISLDMSGMDGLLHLDESARLATLGAGAAGPRVEAQLGRHGYVLGHYPQSFEYSTLGGWVVTRSSGQQSLRYGRIEQLFAGGRLATPVGDLSLPTIPSSSAGPDLRDLVLGSEGRLGVLTEASVRVQPRPEREDFHALFFSGWAQAVAAVRRIAQERVPLSMMRLSNAAETETQLMLAGHPRLIAALERLLRVRGIHDEKCLLLIGVTGSAKSCRFARARALEMARAEGGVHMGRAIGKAWSASRFTGPYLRNTLWEAGYGADTVETCVDWPQVTATVKAIERAARDCYAEFDEALHAFTHLSHVYPQGSSVYSTFIFRVTGDYETDLARWKTLKSRVSRAILAQGGTISHQHGVGLDHKPYLAAEKGGETGLAALRSALASFDPDGMMNPGKLLD